MYPERPSGRQPWDGGSPYVCRRPPWARTAPPEQTGGILPSQARVRCPTVVTPTNGEGGAAPRCTTTVSRPPDATGYREGPVAALSRARRTHCSLPPPQHRDELKAKSGASGAARPAFPPRARGLYCPHARLVPRLFDDFRRGDAVPDLRPATDRGASRAVRADHRASRLRRVLRESSRSGTIRRCATSRSSSAGAGGASCPPPATSRGSRACARPCRCSRR